MEIPWRVGRKTHNHENLGRNIITRYRIELHSLLGAGGRFCHLNTNQIFIRIMNRKKKPIISVRRRRPARIRRVLYQIRHIIPLHSRVRTLYLRGHSCQPLTAGQRVVTHPPPSLPPGERSGSGSGNGAAAGAFCSSPGAQCTVASDLIAHALGGTDH